MNPEQFQQLASQGYNRIPIPLQVRADLDAPLSVYLKLANQSSPICLNQCAAMCNGGAIPLSD
jgi:hypothetical protein